MIFNIEPKKFLHLLRVARGIQYVGVGTSKERWVILEKIMRVNPADVIYCERIVEKGRGLNDSFLSQPSFNISQPVKNYEINRSIEHYQIRETVDVKSVVSSLMAFDEEGSSLKVVIEFLAHRPLHTSIRNTIIRKGLQGKTEV